jgi:hypothetical protein
MPQERKSFKMAESLITKDFQPVSGRQDSNLRPPGPKNETGTY